MSGESPNKRPRLHYNNDESRSESHPHRGSILQFTHNAGPLAASSTPSDREVFFPAVYSTTIHRSTLNSGVHTSGHAPDIAETEATDQESDPLENNGTYDLEKILTESPRGAPMERLYLADDDDIGDAILSDEQAEVVEDVRQGKNIFITGAAGTGKSFLLKAIIKMLKEESIQPKQIVKTAMTGIAALNIGGITIHSWSGVGFALKHPDAIIDEACANVSTCKRWQEADVLIIDEISMMEARLFDILDAVARNTRRSDKPFGGLQLILVGDFYQLPPVPEKFMGRELPWKFAFDANAWDCCIDKLVDLKVVHRQADPDFCHILKCIRYGIVTKDIIEKMKSLDRPLSIDPAIGRSTYMFAKREAGAMVRNSEILGEMDAAKYIYKAVDSYRREIDGVHVTLDIARDIVGSIAAAETLPLCVGARVMLLQNIVAGRLVNGSRGTVIGFHTIVEAANLRIEISLTPTPPSNIEKHRGKSDRHLRLVEAVHQLKHNVRRMEYNPKARCLMSGLIRLSDSDHAFTLEQKYPLVEFDNNIKMLCVPTSFKQQGRRGIEGERLQIPIILAWAITMHKAQGQTMPYASVDLDGVFETGHVYVALSRATSMDRLEVKNFDPHKVRSNERVKSWQLTWDLDFPTTIRALSDTPENDLKEASDVVHRVLPQHDRHVPVESASQIRDRLRIYARGEDSYSSSNEDDYDYTKLDESFHEVPELSQVSAAEFDSVDDLDDLDEWSQEGH